MLTGAQIRMARGYLKWSVRILAEKTNLGDSTIQRMEAAEGVPSASAKNLAVVQSVLEKAGIEFLDENGGGPGMRLRK